MTNKVKLHAIFVTWQIFGITVSKEIMPISNKSLKYMIKWTLLTPMKCIRNTNECTLERNECKWMIVYERTHKHCPCIHHDRLLAMPCDVQRAVRFHVCQTSSFDVIRCRESCLLCHRCYARHRPGLGCEPEGREQGLQASFHCCECHQLDSRTSGMSEDRCADHRCLSCAARTNASCCCKHNYSINASRCCSELFN